MDSMEICFYMHIEQNRNMKSIESKTSIYIVDPMDSRCMYLSLKIFYYKLKVTLTYHKNIADIQVKFLSDGTLINQFV